MHLSLNWLRSYVRLPESGEKLARLLTERSFETSVLPSELRADLRMIRVGEVLSVERHPRADRLSVATVRVGRRAPQIVCGAPNVRPGLRVAVASPGAKIRDAEGALVPLRAVDIRGVRSDGMICSERELGLGPDHEGILELPPDAPLNASLNAVFPKDELLDADVLPNRVADCLSHLGIARELGALLGRKVAWPAVALPASRGKPPFSVRIENHSLCPRYLAAVVEDVRGDAVSPLWLQRRLRAIGVRPQNLIVDVTNYVLWEIGQPTHAFDARAIGKTIGVRETRTGSRQQATGTPLRPSGFAGQGRERLRTLDGVERELPEGTLVITSDNRPIGIAGVIGGADSAVRPDTTTIVLESALFDRATIRKTAQELGLRTDAADRFRRGRTTVHVEAGAARAIALLRELAGARVTAWVDVYPHPVGARTVSVDTQTVGALLGLDVPPARQRKILVALGCRVSGRGSRLRVVPPVFRDDLALPQDIADEVGRVIGLDRIPLRVPRAPLVAPVVPEEIRLIRAVQDVLRSAGWNETMTYSFSREEETLALGLHKVEHLQVVNPLNRDQVRLRVSLLPNLLHQAWAGAKKEPVLRLYELGRVYRAQKGEGKEWKSREPLRLSGLLVRRGGTAHEHQARDFYDVKGLLEHLAEALGLSGIRFQEAAPTPKETFQYVWAPGRSAEVLLGGKEVGYLGAVDRAVLDRVGISGSVVAFDVDFVALVELEKAARTYEPPLPYPTVVRDLSLLVPEGVLVDALMQAIDRASPLVRDVDVLDLYEGEELPDGQRSVTLRIVYASPERTLTDKEVNARQARVNAVLEEQFGVRVRE